MGGGVFVRTLQLHRNLAGAITFEPFVGDGRPGTSKFFRRFTAMEKRLARDGRDSTRLTPKDWDEAWTKVKGPRAQ